MGESRPSEEAIALFTNVFGYAPDPEALHAGECWQVERIDAALRRAKAEGRQEGKDYAWNEAAMRAVCAAHRACCGIEADNSQGKIHGYCVVCGVPWPCETAQFFLFKADARAAQIEAEQ